MTGRARLKYLSAVLRLSFGFENTVEPRSDGPASNGIPLIKDTYYCPFNLLPIIFYFGCNRIPPITDKQSVDKTTVVYIALACHNSVVR